MFLDRSRFIRFLGLASACATNQEKDHSKNKNASRDRLQTAPPVYEISEKGQKSPITPIMDDYADWKEIY